ncbi:hypothetical protein QQY79_07990 [Flavobacterium tructae]|uniref:hypothetical protein n=1 Tax=Flavobacterium tructae TaxID=1114873 RepID=UPI00255205F2|nr:hypothetical protein [Flavobacterium tructae]MDL2142458.1 hypothetical protein [Flavobacterium tructae]
MKCLSLVLVLILGYSLDSYGQENNEIKLIRDFYKALYINDIDPEEIVARYIKCSDADQCKKGVYMVMDFRNLANEEKGNFFLLKKDIMENNFFISSYNSFPETAKIKFKNLVEDKRKEIYKVDLRNGAPQYFLIEKDKIVSFFGFQKAGSEDYTFIVF